MKSWRWRLADILASIVMAIVAHRIWWMWASELAALVAGDPLPGMRLFGAMAVGCSLVNTSLFPFLSRRFFLFATAWQAALLFGLSLQLIAATAIDPSAREVARHLVAHLPVPPIATNEDCFRAVGYLVPAAMVGGIGGGIIRFFLFSGFTFTGGPTPLRRDSRKAPEEAEAEPSEGNGGLPAGGENADRVLTALPSRWIRAAAILGAIAALGFAAWAYSQA